MPYLLFAGEAALFAIPVLIYFLVNRQFAKGHPFKTALSAVLFVFLFGLYCFPKERPGYGHVAFLLFALGAKLLLLPVHWFAWLRITVKRSPVTQHTLPLATVCFLLMIRGISLEAPYVLFAAAMFALLCYFLCSPQKATAEAQEP